MPFQEFYYKYLVDDEKLLKKIYKEKFGKDLDLKNPKTFNEKLQYLKLIQRDEKFSIMSDKYRVREYVKEKIGEEILVPLLWYGEEPKDIPWEKLPNKFVIKANHDSGSTIIVKDKDNIDKKYVEKLFRYYLKRNFYLYGREYNYKNIPKKIIIEKFLNFKNDEIPNDYKFWVFNGKVEFMNIHFHEDGITKINIYNKNLELQNFGMEYPNNLKKKLEFPKNYKKMVEYAEIFAKDFPFLRVDLYEVDGKIFFGELTFYPTSGFIHFFPNHEKLDEYYGSLLDL